MTSSPLPLVLTIPSPLSLLDLLSPKTGTSKDRPPSFISSGQVPRSPPAQSLTWPTQMALYGYQLPQTPVKGWAEAGSDRERGQ